MSTERRNHYSEASSWDSLTEVEERLVLEGIKAEVLRYGVLGVREAS
jgi:hypothetical protein